MKILLNLFLFVFISSSLPADQFVGSWQVCKLDMPETYGGEIKYPKSFRLFLKGEKIEGEYIDQYDNPFRFSMSEIVNDGDELLLMMHGTTKHRSSWVPLHKVKRIQGNLVGVVITDRKAFVWHAKPVDSLPSNSSEY